MTDPISNHNPNTNPIFDPNSNPNSNPQSNPNPNSNPNLNYPLHSNSIPTINSTPQNLLSSHHLHSSLSTNSSNSSNSFNPSNPSHTPFPNTLPKQMPNSIYNSTLNQNRNNITSGLNFAINNFGNSGLGNSLAPNTHVSSSQIQNQGQNQGQNQDQNQGQNQGQSHSIVSHSSMHDETSTTSYNQTQHSTTQLNQGIHRYHTHLGQTQTSLQHSQVQQGYQTHHSSQSLQSQRSNQGPSTNQGAQVPMPSSSNSSSQNMTPYQLGASFGSPQSQIQTQVSQVHSQISHHQQSQMLPTSHQHAYPYQGASPYSNVHSPHPHGSSPSPNFSPTHPFQASHHYPSSKFSTQQQQFVFPRDQLNPLNHSPVYNPITFPSHVPLGVQAATHTLHPSTIGPMHPSLQVIPPYGNTVPHAMGKVGSAPTHPNTRALKEQKLDLIPLKRPEPKEIPESVKEAVINAANSIQSFGQNSRRSQVPNQNLGTSSHATSASSLSQSQEQDKTKSSSLFPGSKPQLPTLSSLMEKRGQSIPQKSIQNTNQAPNAQRQRSSLVITTLGENIQQSRLGKMLQRSETSHQLGLNTKEQSSSKPSIRWKPTTDPDNVKLEMHSSLLIKNESEIPKTEMVMPNIAAVAEDKMDIDEEVAIGDNTSDFGDEEEDMEDDGEDILKNWARIPSKHTSVIRYLYKKDPRPTPAKIARLQSSKIQYFTIRNHMNVYNIKIDPKHPFLTIKYNVGLQPTNRHAYYFEVTCINTNNDSVSNRGEPHCRVGYVTSVADDRVPIGYCENSVSYRDMDGSVVHCSKRREYGEKYCSGDVIGCLIYMPETEEDHEEPIVQVDAGDREVKQKGETFEFILEVLKKDVIEGSFIAFFKNGVYQGIAQNNLRRCLWYPAVSLYMGAEVKLNLGYTEFQHFPKNLGSLNLPDVPVVSIESVTHFKYHPTYIASPLDKRIEKFKNKLEQSILPVKRKAHSQIPRPLKKQTSSSMQDEPFS